MEIGITDWSAWVPYYRLTGAVVRGTFASGKGSRALASFDEDVVTMAAGAVRRLRMPAESLALASVSFPYAEKQHAAIVAAAADWPTACETADAAGNLRAGLSSLLGALDTVAAGRLATAAVVAADLRPTAAGSAQELAFGDGAVALTVGAAPALAFRGAATVTRESMDLWRRAGAPVVLEADAKFVEQESYTVFQPQALDAALAKAGWEKRSLKRVYAWAPDARILAAVGKAMELAPEQLPQHLLFDELGALGGAHVFALLLADAHTLRPGDRIALTGHGAGAQALLFEATDNFAKLPPDAWTQATARSAPWPGYGAHLIARGLVAGEKLDPFTAAPVWRREEAALLRRHAAVCEACGELHYPPQALCRKCRSERFRAQRLGDLATVVTDTADHLYPSPLAPTVMVSADVDGGGRFYGQLADAHGQSVAIGERLAFTFRRIHEGGGFINYFWKLMPCSPAKSPL